MESYDFLVHKAAHCAVEKSSFISEPPNSDLEFESALRDLNSFSTANNAVKLDSFWQAILNNDIDITPIDSETDPQISELVIWIDTKAVLTGGYV